MLGRIVRDLSAYVNSSERDVDGDMPTPVTVATFGTDSKNREAVLAYLRGNSGVREAYMVHDGLYGDGTVVAIAEQGSIANVFLESPTRQVQTCTGIEYRIKPADGKSIAGLLDIKTVYRERVIRQLEEQSHVSAVYEFPGIETGVLVIVKADTEEAIIQTKPVIEKIREIDHINGMLGVCVV